MNHFLSRHLPAALKPLSLVIIGLALSGATPAISWAQSVSATQVQARNYNLPSAPLAEQLLLISREAGLVLTLDATLVQGKTAAAVQSSMNAVQALQQALAGSGLELVSNVSGAYSLRPLANGAAAVLPTVKVSDQILGQTTENSGSYTTGGVTAGSNMEQTLREVPRSISVIGREQLNDQRITSFEEALEQLPGVTLTRADGWGAGGISVRGYALTNILVDGAPARGIAEGDTSLNTGMAKYDNIQLVRGPDGLFSGNGQPSGSINLVRKRPQQTFQLLTTLSAGSWENYLGEVDLSSPLTGSGNVRGRLVASYNDTEKFYDDAHRKNSTVYGIVETDVTERTLLSAGASVDRRRGDGSDHAPAFPRYSNGTPLPLSRSFGLPAFSFRDSDSVNYFADLKHHFSNDWIAKINYSHTESDGGTFLPYYSGAVDPLTGQGSTFFRWADLYYWDSESDAADASLTGSFRFLEREHRVIVGANHLRTHSHGDIHAIASGLAGVQIDWDTFNPRSLTSYTIADAVSFRNNKQTQQGVYAYGSFQLQGALRLILGGRYASYENIDARYRLPAAPSPVLNKSDDIFTPYYALVYDIDKHWTVFFSASESYEDQSNLYNENNTPLNPTTGRSFELGIKGEHANGLLNSQLTLYRSSRENYAVKVSDSEDFDVAGKACCYRGDGEFLSQGVEFDISGELLPGWQINAGYTWNDNETRYGTSNGKSFSTDKPEHIFRLWSRYNLNALVSGLTVGGGVNSQSGFFKTGTVTSWNPVGGEGGSGAWNGPAVPYSFNEPGRAVWNVFAQYQLAAQWTASVNINNIFDKHYFSAVNSTSGGNIVGEPRNVMVTVRGSF